MQSYRRWFSAAVVVIFLVALPASLAAQADKSKRPSPPGTAEVVLGGKKITIDYSRPSMRGRKIMGDLVPYGKVWRTGANEATALATETDLVIGGTKVPAGKYTIYTLPSATAWKLILNKQTGQWGTVYDETKDFARIDMKMESPKEPVEQFTVSFDKKDEKRAALSLTWETTRVSVDVEAK